MTSGASVRLIAFGTIMLFAITAGLAGVSLKIIGAIFIVAGAVELLGGIRTGRWREPI
jgi:hypothetical protein